jgi:biotin synthase-like enzyme
MQLKDPKLFRQQCYIDGAWVDAGNRETIAVNNPADNSIFSGEKLLTTANPEHERDRRLFDRLGLVAMPL